jgi:hypothetical protein
VVEPAWTVWRISAVFTVVVPELALGAVGAQNDDLLEFVLFRDGQVRTPTMRLGL